MGDGPQAPEGHSRRSVLGKLLIGSLALLSAVPLLKGYVLQGEDQEDTDGEFPPEGSMFHPSQDPRSDPRRAA